MSLRGKVAVVTGASRGIGCGIALQLGEARAKVYVTGRDPKNRKVDPDLPTLEQTAQEITKRGGQGIPVYVDHSDDAQIKQLFDRVAHENNGQLDVLVNNAYAAMETLVEQRSKKFWESGPETWDVINKVGLRSHYTASVYAARLFVKNKKGGLIVNISSYGGAQYFFGVAYGVGKAAVDRLAVDMAHELKPHKVAAVSLWPGFVKTEFSQKKFKGNPGAVGQPSKVVFWFLLTIFAILVIFQCQGDNFAYHTRPGNSACGPWVDPENEEYIAVNPGLFDSRRGEICSDQGLCFRVKHPSLGERTFRIKDRMEIYRNDLSLKAFRSYTGLLYKDYKNKGHFDGNGEVVSC